MGKNSDEYGSNGQDIEQIYGYKVTVVGANLNAYPSVREDETGVETAVYRVGGSQGTVTLKGAHSNYTPIDNGGDHHTGDYNIWCGNRFTVEAGAGGLILETHGNTNIHSYGGITSLLAKHQINLSARVVSINATEAIDLRGPINVFNASKGENEQGTSTFAGNLAVGKNLHVGGGAYINGELYVNHITAQRQTNVTEMAGETVSYINPAQNFLLFQGKSTAAKTVMPGVSLLTSQIPNSPGMIDCNITIPFPSPIDSIITLPCKIGFPSGVSIVSDTTALTDPTTTAQVIKKSIDKSTPTANPLQSDVFGPPHVHEFSTPAMTLVDSTDEVWKAAQSVDKAEAAEASPMNYNGMSPEQFMKKVVDMQKQQGIDSLKDKIKSFFMSFIS